MADPLVLCGPSGWSHPHWEEVIYPESKPRGFHALEHLARYLDLVEIRASFTAALRPEITKVWARKVEANRTFRFTALLNRRFTHDRALDAQTAEEWKQGLRPLKEAGRLGCVVMQFPWSFRYTKENREYLIRLRREFHEFPLAAEMRHSSWMLDEALGVFIDYHVAFVNIDQPDYTKAMPPTSFLTSAVGYVRLHGRSRFHWDHDSRDPTKPSRIAHMYSDEELQHWRERVDRVSAYSKATYVVFTNDACGRSVVNALQLQSMVESRHRQLPLRLIRRFPAQLSPVAAPVQGSLFGGYTQVA